VPSCAIFVSCTIDVAVLLPVLFFFLSIYCCLESRIAHILVVQSFWESSGVDVLFNVVDLFCDTKKYIYD
jgi:hypothetical protein